MVAARASAATAVRSSALRTIDRMVFLRAGKPSSLRDGIRSVSVAPRCARTCNGLHGAAHQVFDQLRRSQTKVAPETDCASYLLANRLALARLSRIPDNEFECNV